MSKTIFEKAAEMSNLISHSEQEISIEIISGENRISLREKKQQTLLLKKLVDLKLLHAGCNRLAVVKLVKELTGLGLKEAKDLIDQVPYGDQSLNRSEIFLAIKIEEPKAISAKVILEEAGAKVQIVEKFNL